MKTHSSQELDPVAWLRQRLGTDVVLIEIPRGKKGPTRKEWQNTTLEDMNRVDYLETLKTGNIGVLLGKPSNGLCSIDVDGQNGEDEEFLKLNPALKNTLQSRGSRGRNFWVRITGDFPKSGKISYCERRSPDGKSKDWGEWRADGNQTVIYGRHPSGCDYKILCDAKPAEVTFDSLVWPEDLSLPWDFGLYGELVKTEGEPFSVTWEGTVLLNHPFFVAKFATEHLVLFEPKEKTFYNYNDQRGLWQRATEESLKTMFSKDLKGYADSQGLSEIERKRSNGLLKGLTDQLRGQVERRDIFAGQKQAIHLNNGMLHLDTNPPEVREFSPSYYSRNQCPIDLVRHAQCPRFENELLRSALEEDDISLLQRWSGSLLLGRNKAQKILILHGGGGRGKSTIVEIIEGIVGTENVTELRTDHLAERFELFRFVGKTLLTGKDVPADFLMRKGASMLKKLVGDDLLTPEGKNSNSAENMRGNFDMVITANSRLKVRLEGDEEAWRRRLLVIEPTKPGPEKVIREFAKLLLKEEAPGILLWMIRGAIAHKNELQESGNFELTTRQVERIDDLLAESDSVRAFVQRCLKPATDGPVTTEELFGAYCKFCYMQGWDPMAMVETQKRFPDLIKHFCGVTRRNDIKDSLFGTHHGYSVRILSEYES